MTDGDQNRRGSIRLWACEEAGMEVALLESERIHEVREGSHRPPSPAYRVSVDRWFEDAEEMSPRIVGLVPPAVAAPKVEVEESRRPHVARVARRQRVRLEVGVLGVAGAWCVAVGDAEGGEKKDACRVRARRGV